MRYIQGPTNEKVEYLIESHNAVVIDMPTELPDRGKVVVVIENGIFDTAMVVDDLAEVPKDRRPKTYLYIDEERIAGDVC